MPFSRKRKDEGKVEIFTDIGPAQPVLRVPGDFTRAPKQASATPLPRRRVASISATRCREKPASNGGC